MTEVNISPERKEAMVITGIWDDPELHAEYLRRCAVMDELVQWIAWTLEALVTGNLWDDLTPRSLDNDFNCGRHGRHI